MKRYCRYMQTLLLGLIFPLAFTGTMACCGLRSTAKKQPSAAEQKHVERMEKQLADLAKHLEELRGLEQKRALNMERISKKITVLTKEKQELQRRLELASKGNGEAAPSTRGSDSGHANRCEAFAPIPRRGGASSRLRMRILKYSNGKMEIQVCNPTSAVVVFSPKGLYFVPAGDPRRAPQRMGAAGPFERYMSGRWTAASGTTEIAPYDRARLRLQVFCLDRSRRWPSDGYSFRVAAKRLPKDLANPIDSGVRRIMKGRRSFRKAGKEKGAVQRHIWKTRAENPYQLEGE